MNTILIILFFLCTACVIVSIILGIVYKDKILAFINPDKVTDSSKSSGSNTSKRDTGSESSPSSDKGSGAAGSPSKGSSAAGSGDKGAKPKPHTTTTDIPTSKTVPQKILDGAVHLVTNPKIYVQIAADEILRTFIKKAIDGTIKRIILKIASKIEVAVLKISARILEKIALKIGDEGLARLGIKFTEKAAKILAEKIAEKTAAKLGSRVAAQQAAVASTGPGAPFVEIGFAAFDLLSIGLDLGDAGGYARMGTKAEYLDFKKDATDQMKKAFIDAGGIWESVTGPLDGMSVDEYTKLIKDGTTAIMSSSNPIDPLVAPMIAKIIEDCASGKLKPDDLDSDSAMKPYLDLVDFDAVTDKAVDLICTSHNGRTVTTGAKTKSCSYKNRQACEASYNWPDIQHGTYSEYRDDLYGGSCVLASYGVRSLCDGANIPYDKNTGICTVTETYCKSKGADWKFNKDINDYDCETSTVQDIAEMMFGTTIVRGLKQVFDPAQYETCGVGETDTGLFCNSNSCGDDKDKVGALCYPKCKSGYHAFGSNLCTPDCQSGYTDDGASCRLPNHCADDQDHNGALCYPKCDDGYKGIGPVCWQVCPPGYTDTGAFCSRGGSTVTKSITPPHKGSCPDGTRDDGTSCWDDPDTYYKGFLCNGGCRDGYTDNGCFCGRTGRGIVKNLFQRQSCDAGYSLIAGLCHQDCPPGYTNTGLTCIQPVETITKSSHGRGAGTPDTKITLKGAAYGRGFGTPSVGIRPKKRIVPYSTKSN